ncbi:MAG: hypothetical protein KC635_18665 [Myxococcales bacterium]|nr:hypothetical protein [Myxococcales bacterium]MCB9737301.1 hypothetical protein [Deltaproteobacteria bacterium]
MFALVLFTALTLAAPAAPAVPATAHDPRAGAVLLPNGLALPYPTLDVYRAFGKCRGNGRHNHEAIDLGGVGPNGGLGTAVRAMARSRVVEIGLGAKKPGKYGYPDTREGSCRRGRFEYPRQMRLAGYGLVTFFTRHKGAWRTGNVVITEVLDGPLAGHTVRYMHLGAARPDLKRGDVLEPGEELGVLGGTAVQESAPHVHIDVHDPDGNAVDVAPLIGLHRSAWCGPALERGKADQAAFEEAAKGLAWRPRAWEPPVGAGPGKDRAGLALKPVDLLRTPVVLVEQGVVPEGARVWRKRFVVPTCRAWAVEDDFRSGAYAAHAYETKLFPGQWIDLDLEKQGGDALPGLVLVDLDGQRAIPPEGIAGLVRLEPLVGAVDHQKVRLLVDAKLHLLVSLVAPTACDATAVRYGFTAEERCKAAPRGGGGSGGAAEKTGAP